MTDLDKKSVPCEGGLDPLSKVRLKNYYLNWILSGNLVMILNILKNIYSQESL